MDFSHNRAHHFRPQNFDGGIQRIKESSACGFFQICRRPLTVCLISASGGHCGSKGIPEAYIKIIRNMYYDSASMVRTAVGDTKPLQITVGFLQGSALWKSSGTLDPSCTKHRSRCPWPNKRCRGKWREVVGVVCDRKIPPKLKGLIYKSIIRPVLLYGSECWPTLSRHTQEVHVTEMKMLRCVCGVTRSDRIRN